MSAITADEIISAKPNIFYTLLLSCNNGAFKTQNYLAGEMLFNGDSLLVEGNSDPTFIGGFLEDLPIQPVFFQPLSFLNSNDILGELVRNNTSLFITQTFGDPTLRLAGNSNVSSNLAVSSSDIDFGKIGKDSSVIKTMTIKNIGNTIASVLTLPNVSISINNKSLPELHTGVALGPLPQKNFLGFISDKTESGFFKKIAIAPGEQIIFTYTFSPAAQNTKPIQGKYYDVMPLLTSDVNHPYIDVTLHAEYFE